MNTRTIGIVFLAILAIALLASTVHYANKASAAEDRCKAIEAAAAKDAASMNKAMDDQKVFAAFITGDPGTVTVAAARTSIGIEAPKTVRAELDALRADRDRLTKQNAELRQQASAAAAQAADAARAAADAAALRASNEELAHQVSKLKQQQQQQIESARAASTAAAPAAAPRSQPAPVAAPAAPAGPSAYWIGKEWPSDAELRHMMWRYHDTNKVDLEQPLEYREAEKELRRRTGVN